MMTFEEFVSAVEKGVGEAMGCRYDVTVKKVPKNNGLTLTGLLIAEKENGVAPAIYLDSLYEPYIGGCGYTDLESVIDSIIASYREQEMESRRFSKEMEDLKDYQEVRDKIIFKLINSQENQELLSQVPNIPFQDLSIVFVLYIEETEDGILTALIHNEHMSLWDVTANDLYTEAMRNTPRLLPEKFMRMDEIIRNLAIEAEEGQELDIPCELMETEEPPFYVLTNRLGITGAACLLYPDVLRNCAEKLGQDLLILPSSIHESLILPYDESIKLDDMRYMVQSINVSEVPVEDRLSGQVYLYHRSDDRIVIAA